LGKKHLQRRCVARVLLGAEAWHRVDSSARVSKLQHRASIGDYPRAPRWPTLAARNHEEPMKPQQLLDLGRRERAARQKGVPWRNADAGEREPLAVDEVRVGMLIPMSGAAGLWGP